MPRAAQSLKLPSRTPCATHQHHPVARPEDRRRAGQSQALRTHGVDPAGITLRAQRLAAGCEAVAKLMSLASLSMARRGQSPLAREAPPRSHLVAASKRPPRERDTRASTLGVRGRLGWTTAG